ncbi:RES family NAD+ phosphorylase [sulfur-oxidizing endosymbiont of Gigantopelta aegis]|uniref:RES family NAD+ phosphorylase n=1 Tax=sulfur-oxidizing endosymbiont of Gigantopelta aegis TaxID=2794934 RepID=UPI0018DE38CC|nr:RES family NAD+ phosphorylase [sulfur-oxidizing endosymbiont of Gigantopelta aegis]
MPGVDKKPRQKNIKGLKHYRIIASRYPPVGLFEKLVDPDELDILFEIESLTNDRLREQVGDISLIANEDRMTGSGSSPVMAAFTHIGHPSRFTEGQTYGVYYAGLNHGTAIKEICFHHERNLSFTHEPACELQMRCYVGTVRLPLHDKGVRDENGECVAFFKPVSTSPVKQSKHYPRNLI